jgi:hypothetical protein
MTIAGPPASFSLTYEVQPDDLQELIESNARRKRLRGRLIFATAVWALINVPFTAVTVALDLPSVVKDTLGAPSWMYVVDAGIWFFVAYGAVIAWRLSPKRLARRAWRASPQLHGRCRAEVDAGGITVVAPDGTRTSTPWANIVHIRETEKAFYLRDRRDASRGVLPKRGLHSPDLTPALREFLNRSVNGQPSSAAIPDSTADGSKRPG